MTRVAGDTFDHSTVTFSYTFDEPGLHEVSWRTSGTASVPDDVPPELWNDLMDLTSGSPVNNKAGKTTALAL